MLIVTFLLGVIICMLLFEKWSIQKSINSIQVRVLVNGTRGKSSVTEYIAAGIYNEQSDVMAKVTGIIPTVIYNGKEITLKRTGAARVQEQINIIRLASRKKVKSLVLECMSVSPELQRLESRLFKPHYYVITNIKDDHREVMGKSIEEQVNSICSAIPKNCTVITNENCFYDEIKKASSLKNSRVIKPDDLKPELFKKLPSGIFSVNVSLALSVCDTAGINHELAENGIMNWTLNSTTPLNIINYENKEITFLNAFSVNDTDSADYFINYWQNKIGFNGKISVIFNTRSDRPLRTDLFAEWLVGLSSSIDYIIITGDHSQRGKYSILKTGTDKRKVFTLNRKLLKNFKKYLFDLVPDGSWVIGIGNIGGDGFEIINKMK